MGNVADEREKALRELLGSSIIEKREFYVEKKKSVERKIIQKLGFLNKMI